MKSQELSFFDPLKFRSEAKEAAAKALVNIAKQYGGACYMAGGSLKRTAKAHEGAIILTPDHSFKGGSHNRPLYLEANVNSLSVKRARVDNGSSVNLMPLSTFKAAKIPDRYLIPQPIVLCFQDSALTQ